MLTLPQLNLLLTRTVLFHGWWIYSYLHIRWSSDCQGGVQIGSLKTLWPDRNACIDDTECPGRKTAFWLINMRWTVKNFALSLNDRNDEVKDSRKTSIALYLGFLRPLGQRLANIFRGDSYKDTIFQKIRLFWVIVRKCYFQILTHFSFSKFQLNLVETSNNISFLLSLLSKGKLIFFAFFLLRRIENIKVLEEMVKKILLWCLKTNTLYCLVCLRHLEVYVLYSFI